MFNKIWSTVIKSWDSFWESYEISYTNTYGMTPNELYNPFTFYYFGSPCFISPYCIPDYHQTENEE